MTTKGVYYSDYLEGSCAYCAFARYCEGTEDLYLCVTKDMFVQGGDYACPSYADEAEEEGLLVDGRPFDL